MYLLKFIKFFFEKGDFILCKLYFDKREKRKISITFFFLEVVSYFFGGIGVFCGF